MKYIKLFFVLLSVGILMSCEKENEDLQDENCSLDSENDMLREKIEQLEDMLEN